MDSYRVHFWIECTHMVLYEAILVSCEFMLGTFWDPTDLGPYKNQPWLCSPKTKNAYFLPLSTAPVPCKSQIISNIDDRSELVLSMRCCSQLVRSSWLLFPTSAQLVGNGFAGLSLVPWTSVIQNGRPTFRSYGPISTHI